MVGLRLDFVPVQPSHLRHSYTPRSPASPLESIAKRIRCTKTTGSSDDSSDSDSSSESFSSSPPPSPYKWMWYCHQCRTGYELGVTRRCLIDDHQLCYGQPVKKRSKKGRKKQQACQSEFDYTGWQNWGAWKRLGTESEGNESVQRNCSAQCDWPSQCRWARKEEQSVESKSNESVPRTTQQAVTEPPQKVTQEAATPIEETPATACNEHGPAQPQKPTESPFTSIAIAARQLTSRWTSLLAPIPEEEPASATIESFLNSHKTQDINSTLPTEPAKPLLRNPPTIDFESSNPSFDFDFDFSTAASVAEKAPSLAGGLHGLVARTVGIALFTPTKTRLEPRDHSPGLKHRRCVSAPARTKAIERPDDQPKRKRRMSR
ncbi:MAG: hypothetical protein LQ346_004208 [Caloplaca aetnensis]|nr:MAG: hypothetical protein LQ346_004208 [Caloplaca aetnensis]